MRFRLSPCTYRLLGGRTNIKYEIFSVGLVGCNAEVERYVMTRRHNPQDQHRQTSWPQTGPHISYETQHSARAAHMSAMSAVPWQGATVSGAVEPDTHFFTFTILWNNRSQSQSPSGLGLLEHWGRGFKFWSGTGVRAGRPGPESRQGQKSFLSVSASRLLLGPTQWVLGADRSSPSTTEIEIELSYTSFIPIRLRGVMLSKEHEDNPATGPQLGRSPVLRLLPHV